MIVLSTTVLATLNVPLIFDETSGTDLCGIARRVSRTATLDGGALFADYGYTDADRTLTVEGYMNFEQYQQLGELVADYPMLTLASREGLFQGAVQTMNRTSNGARFTFLVGERLA